MKQVIVFRWLTLLGYFGLMTLIFSWHLLIKPLPPEFMSITLLIQLVPLMFPLRGLLHGKTYTHVWASYLALFYFVMGVWYAANAGTLLFGIFICLFNLDFFIGGFLCALRLHAHNAIQPPRKADFMYTLDELKKQNREITDLVDILEVLTKHENLRHNPYAQHRCYG